MIKQIYAIFDEVAQQLFGPIMVLPNDAVARRTFQDALFTPGAIMTTHPQDFTLFHLGSLNLETGLITPRSEAPTQDNACVIIAGDVLVELTNNRKAPDAG